MKEESKKRQSIYGSLNLQLVCRHTLPFGKNHQGEYSGQRICGKCRWRGGTSEQVGEDWAGGVVGAGAAEAAGGAPHEQRRGAARQPTQNVRRQVLLAAAVAAEHKQLALSQRGRQLSARQPRRSHAALPSEMQPRLVNFNSTFEIANRSLLEQ